jgi:hypothetical protein
MVTGVPRVKSLKILCLAFLICVFSFSSIIGLGWGQVSPNCKISGYILDANGQGIAGAEIIFNVPNIVPAVFTNSSGYYMISAPSGTYHVTVWPPFDSNYVCYDQKSLVVNSDIVKNITLSSGFKVSGYIKDSSGKPVKDGIVLLDNCLSGWFSNDTGYYFVTAPAGTYKLTAKPRSGYNHFLSSSEPNFVVNGNMVKNITVNVSASETIYVQVQSQYDGKVIFTTEKLHTSPKSLKLLVPKNATSGSFAMALYPYNGTLGSISSFSIMTSYTTAVPRFVLCLEKNGHGWPDTFLLSDYQFPSNGEWKATTGGNGWGWTETNIQMSNYSSVWNPLDYWIAKYSNLKVNFIGIILEYWAVDPDGYGQPLYADELTVNGVTYNISPMPDSTPKPNPTPTPTPEPEPSPSPEPSPDTLQTMITIEAYGNGPPGINSVVNVTGRLCFLSTGLPLVGETVLLSVFIANNASWAQKRSLVTGNDGYFNVELVDIGSELLYITVEYMGRDGIIGSKETTFFSFPLFENQQAITTSNPKTEPPNSDIGSWNLIAIAAITAIPIICVATLLKLKPAKKPKTNLNNTK